MASKLTRGAIGAGRALRPSLIPRALPTTTSLLSTRHASSTPAEEPSKKAQSIIDALPGNSLVSKTAILSAGTGVSIWAIANEIYVVNEESIVMLATLSVFYAVARYGGPMYKEWADGQINKMKGILNSAREGHTAAVKDRIESVKQLGGVVEVTKQLFEVSKVCFIRELVVLWITGEHVYSWVFGDRKPPRSKPKSSSWSRRRP
ncbi:MAG: hypothetical protein Q9192_007737 [Flavoplaca navasiana]